MREWLSGFGCRISIPVLVLLGVSLGSSGRADAPPVGADFDKTIAPILVKNCVNCHNASEPKGGFDLTRKEGLLKGGKSGPAVVAGKPEESYLIQRVTEGSMPPKKKGPRLSAGDVAFLTHWVKAGAIWPAGR